MNPPTPLDFPFLAIPFIKMHGVGNDFVVLDLFHSPMAGNLDFALLAEAMCDRHFGVGADGLLSLEPSTDGNEVRMRMWNPDGSEDMCGNGLRCVARLAHARGYVGESFSAQTLAGTRRAFITAPGMVRVSMGAPDFSPPNVPLAQDEPLIEGRIELDGRLFSHVTTLSTGSTHTVIFGEVPVDEVTFETWSPRLEVAPLFPERTSIMWAHPLGPNRFGVRIWERGAGETLACGTGACAVAIAARVSGRATGEVQVRSRGGELRIEWDESQNQIWKIGPATVVFEGVWRRS
jgi:diaminopimelate epimerase